MDATELKPQNHHTGPVPPRLARIYAKRHTVTSVATAIGRTKGLVSKSLSGKTRHAATQAAIAGVVGLHPEDLFDSDCHPSLRRQRARPVGRPAA